MYTYSVNLWYVPLCPYNLCCAQVQPLVSKPVPMIAPGQAMQPMHAVRIPATRFQAPPTDKPVPQWYCRYSSRAGTGGEAAGPSTVLRIWKLESCHGVHPQRPCFWPLKPLGPAHAAAAVPQPTGPQRPSVTVPRQPGDGTFSVSEEPMTLLVGLLSKS